MLRPSVQQTPGMVQFIAAKKVQYVVHHYFFVLITSVVTIPNFAMRYVSRYLGHDAIRITILVYRISQCLDLQFVYDGNAIYMPRSLYSVTTIGAECAGR